MNAIYDEKGIIKAYLDDEEIFAEKIFKNIDSYMSKKEIPYEIDIFPSGKEFMQLGIEMMKYKVVFLDINMEEVDAAIINTKYREAVDKDILFIVKIGDLSDLRMRDEDIVIILSMDSAHPFGHFLQQFVIFCKCYSGSLGKGIFCQQKRRM